MSKKIPVHIHGFANHAMGCPQRVRIWKGKPYANVVDDCTGCRYFVKLEYDDYGGFESVICDGETE